METITLNAPNRAFIRQVEAESGQDISKCYQCGKCTAGCPMSFTYDYPVSRLMRLIQAGQKDVVLSSRSLWMCATCETCTQRCPNMIDVAKVLDVCRHMARREGKRGVFTVRTFWDNFLNSVSMNGRVHEIGLMVMYMLRTGRVFTDVDLAPKALPKGKMSLVPHSTKGKQEVAAILRRFKEGAANEDVVKANLAARGASLTHPDKKTAAADPSCAPGATPFGLDASTTKLSGASAGSGAASPGRDS